MQEKFTVTYSEGASFSHLMAALEKAAVEHSIDLAIDHDRMLGDFGLLWMLVRCRLELYRQPRGQITVETFLRKPTFATSLRDFTLRDGDGIFGTAVQTWGLVDENQRKLVNMKTVPLMATLPTPTPERSGALRHLNLPEDMQYAGSWRVSPEEIDANGHLNNVCYIRHGEAFTKENYQILEVIYARECFEGEVLSLETGETDGFYVRGVKENGEESFRLCFRKGS